MKDFSRSELKSLARSILFGRYNSYTVVLILYFLADLASSFLPAALFGSEDAFSVIARFTSSFILSTFFGMLGIGLTRVALTVCRKEPSSIKDLIYAFKNSTDAFIKIQLLFAAIRSLFSLIALAADRITEMYGLSYMEYLALLYAAVLIAYFLTMLVTIRLMWSVYYILEEPSLSAVQALKMSLAATRGKTLKLILLKLSFVGMYALGILSMMSGFLYVRPYMEVTYMLAFYRLTGRPLPEKPNEEPETPVNSGPSYWADRNNL